MNFIRGFQTHGHFKADIDPLNMAEAIGEDVSKFYKTGQSEF